MVVIENTWNDLVFVKEVSFTYLFLGEIYETFAVATFTFPFSQNINEKIPMVGEHDENEFS